MSYDELLSATWRLIVRPPRAKYVAVRRYRSHFAQALIADGILTAIGMILLVTAILSQPSLLYASEVLHGGALDQLLATVLFLTGAFMVSAIVALRYNWRLRGLPIVLSLTNLAMLVLASICYDDAVMSIRQDVVDGLL